MYGYCVGIVGLCVGTLSCVRARCMYVHVYMFIQYRWCKFLAHLSAQANKTSKSACLWKSAEVREERRGDYEPSNTTTTPNVYTVHTQKITNSTGNSTKFKVFPSVHSHLFNGKVENLKKHTHELTSYEYVV